MVGSLDRPVYSAVVGFQVGAYQDIVDSEIELVLIIRNPQPFAGVGERVVQLLGKDTVSPLSTRLNWNTTNPPS